MKIAINLAAFIHRKTILAVVLSMPVFFTITSCRKTTIASNDLNALRSAAIAWHSQFVKNNSKDNQSAANELISKLDYDDGAVVEQPGSQKIFLIRKKSSDGRVQYFALQEIQNNLQAIGIYHVKDLQQVQRYLRTNELSPGEKISINALNDMPMARRETRADGKPLLSMIQNRKTAEQTLQRNQLRSTDAIKKLNSYPPDGECIDYYWITYDLQTGEIYDIEYAFTSCITNGGSSGNGGNSAASSDEAACLQQGESEIDASDQLSQTLSTSASTSGLIRTRSYYWEICSGATWHITSHETGTHQFSNADNKWHWVSFTHNSVSISGFWLLGSITCSMNSAVSNVYDQYAGMDLYFSINFVWSCGRFTGTRSIYRNRSVMIEVNQTT